VRVPCQWIGGTRLAGLVSDMLSSGASLQVLPCLLWSSGSLALPPMGPLSLTLPGVDLWLPSSCPEIEGPLSSAMSAVDLWLPGSCPEIKGPLSLAMSAVDLWLPSSCPEIKGPLSSAMSAVDLWLPGSCPEIKGPLSLATLLPRLSRRSRAVRFQRWLYLPEQCWRLCDQPRRLFLGPHPCLCNNPRLPGTGGL
jgi:hypothetical protein